MLLIVALKDIFLLNEFEQVHRIANSALYFFLGLIDLDMRIQTEQYSNEVHDS
jgi:hypothetical protein